MHIPVLYQETIEFLRPQPAGRYIDGTVGAGGHAKGILQASAPDGKVLAFDRDKEALIYSRQQLSEAGQRITFVHASYSRMAEVAPAYGFDKADGILLDLGLSSRQLADASRGFSFVHDGPLDMRFDTTSGPTAADLVNELDVSDLATILKRYGEVRQSQSLAKVIANNRPIKTTRQLADLISRESRKYGTRRRGRGSRIHPATQVFQALRIAVNDELAELEQGLDAAVKLLEVGGRLVVISFHSLEDRIVKLFIREMSKDCICPPEQPVCTCGTQPVLMPVRRKIVRPTDAEIANNPRSRSARLRVAERIGGEEL
jgi:16S rRNA (cytosine1402-N4)-methyltransferase